MPIDIQCPDCDQIFGVPSSMAGKRTLCRHCNAALVVPDEEPGDAEPEPLRRGGEKPPNWDTPIPFHSPKPIVGVLLIALLVSVIVLVVYGITRDKTALTKPSNYIPYIAPRPEPIQSDPTKLDVKPPLTQDREVLLPNREVILPGYGGLMSCGFATPPGNGIWTINGEMVSIFDRERGISIASFPRAAAPSQSSPDVSPSGHFFTQLRNRPSKTGTVSVHDAARDGRPVRVWEPYAVRGERWDRVIAGCALLGDDRLLTKSSDNSFDLWSVPEGLYVRHVVAIPTVDFPGSEDCDLHKEKSLLAVRRGTNLEIYRLGDDDFGPQCRLSPTVHASHRNFVPRFTPDGMRVVTRAPAAAPGSTDFTFDRIEVFDIETKKRVAEWLKPSDRFVGDGSDWAVGNDLLLTLRADLKSVFAYKLADGKLVGQIEIGPNNNFVQLDRTNQRVWFGDPKSKPFRQYGFDLPVRAPANFQKNPVWEYNAGVLELKKATR